MTDGHVVADNRLLNTLAEQLRIPLLQIARQAELAAMEPQGISVDALGNTANMALRVIDGYLLSTRLSSIPALELEPISIAAVLQDTAHCLSAVAKQYNCSIEVNLGSRYQPIMAHRESIETAFTMLGYSFVEAQSSDHRQPARVVLGAHKSKQAVVAGIFGSQDGLSSDMYRRARVLYGTAKQPLPTVSHTASAGIFVADTLLRKMSTPLHLARHHKHTGLATTLLPSKQLTMAVL